MVRCGVLASLAILTCVFVGGVVVGAVFVAWLGRRVVLRRIDRLEKRADEALRSRDRRS